MATGAELGGLRWVAPKTAAVLADVSVSVVWGWCRQRVVLARRLPGSRGRLRVAVVEGLPVSVAPAARRRRR
jgi:hypothetical protein